jgi:2-polyprenyl-6-methoxyphenol hydroxylase-like FAD-dependent oxidoreductase
MSVSRQRILIAGAGIGGLAAACALARAGFDVRVVERSPELRPVGAGITVQANAMLALRRIGLDAAVAAEGMTIGLSQLRRADGLVLASTSLAGLERQLGAVSIAIHRARLQRVLVEALGPERISLAAAVVGFDADASSVAVRLADGRRLEADALIGADGLRSVVRTQLHGEQEPLYAGYTTWRGVANAPRLVAAGDATEMWGRGRRVGYVSIGHDEVYWFTVLAADVGGRDRPGQVREELLARFGGFEGPVAQLLAATPEAAIVRTDVFDRPAIDRWGRGRVTLLGDAAHPMTPNLGQGGCQAIEDAIVLGECLLASPGEIEAGLRRYEDRRAARAQWFVAQSRSMGRVAQASGPLTSWLRDTVLRLLPKKLLERQLVAAQRLPD